MGLENVKLMVSTIGGVIYLNTPEEKGMVGDDSIDFTNETLRASTEWFIRNKETMIHFKKDDGNKVWLMHTDNLDKAERINAILKEDSL